ncbi:MAG: Bax inhibitor-1/YccA family protein [Clostridia bacterium]|nr:Bax inhibitor-1/YccA family protein [Clostridia bacterium]
MRIGNPAVRRLVRKAENGLLTEGGAAATYKGVYLKTALYIVLTIIASVATEFLIYWAIFNNHIVEAVMVIGVALGISFIPLIIIALVIAFVPSTAKWLGCVYALLQGALLGLLASMIDLVIPFVSFAAFCATGIVFLVSIIVNSVLKPRISSRFMRGLLVAFISLVVIQLIMVAIMFFTGFIDYTAYVWIQLAVSALCIIWATVMLFWDLQNIDMLVQMGADKKYEWNVAFSLATTLIYLYVEILELLVRLVALFSRNK